jgi:IS30 family transposase
MHRSVYNTGTGQWRSQIKGAISIAERPPKVAARAVPGHWEGDLLLGLHCT